MLIGKCSIDSSSAFLGHGQSAEIDREDVRCLGWFSYKRHTGNARVIRERDFPGKR